MNEKKMYSKSMLLLVAFVVALVSAFTITLIQEKSLVELADEARVSIALAIMPQEAVDDINATYEKAEKLSVDLTACNKALEEEKSFKNSVENLTVEPANALVQKIKQLWNDYEFKADKIPGVKLLKDAIED